RPRVLGEKLGVLDATKPRHYAYAFDAPTLQTDLFEFDLPDGYKVDELPEPAKANFGFGEYSSKIEDSGKVLKYSREYKIKATSIPADKIGELNKFFHQINQDERNMAVLKKGL
ncbi:MAG: transglutaminase, partial [Acidobacteria bacterium]